MSEFRPRRPEGNGSVMGNIVKMGIILFGVAVAARPDGSMFGIPQRFGVPIWIGGTLFAMGTAVLNDRRR